MWNLILPIALLAFPIQRDPATGAGGFQGPEAPAQTAADAHLEELARDIERQVAEIRGMPFKRPVEVHYATKDTFVEYFRSMEQRMGGEQQVERERWLAVLLQLIPSDLDMSAAQEALLASQVGGFYDPGTNTFFVMEGMADDLVRIIMAHELTHALDDQYYDLAAKDLALRGNSDALLAHHAVIEGSAQVVMNQWLIKNLGTLDRKALIEFQEQMAKQSIPDAPRLIWKPLLALYEQGQAFLSRKAKLSLFAKADIKDLDRAFKNLPTSTEQILHPKKYWSENKFDGPHTVEQDLANLPEGWRPYHSDVLGELFLGLLSVPADGALNPMSMLSLEYTDPSNTGWGGDRVQILTKGEQRVLVLDTFWDTAKDAAEFAQALAARDPLVDPLPSRAESSIEFQDGTSWVRLVSWSASSREAAQEVASRIPASASRLGKISSSRAPVEVGSAK